MSIKKLLVGGATSALLVGGLSAVALAASPITNGSFETGPAPGSFITLPTGNTSITGWKVTGGNLDYIGTYWASSEGSRSLDLNGVVPGAISQNLTTLPGHAYTVTFDMAGNPDGGTFSPAVKTLNVDTGGSPTGYSFDTTGHSDANMGWAPQTYNFTATAASTPLTFTSTTTGGTLQWFGPALDNVAVADTTTKDQCKNDGWKLFTDPSFKNQGDCVSYFQSNAHAVANKTK